MRDDRTQSSRQASGRNTAMEQREQTERDRLQRENTRSRGQGYMRSNVSGRGFASMDPRRQHEIASEGGRTRSPNKGFGGMDDNRQREIASEGGRSRSPNKGFGSMDDRKQREISSQGGRASGSTRTTERTPRAPSNDRGRTAPANPGGFFGGGLRGLFRR
jgi:general stress protein YciG